MKSIKHMTLAQLKRIQSNNYCGEHDKNGKQYDYEAAGYKESIDSRIWDLTLKHSNETNKRISDERDYKSALVTKKTASEAFDIGKLNIQLSVLKTFNKWRYLSNEIAIKIA
jgi:hypothetical protein